MVSADLDGIRHALSIARSRGFAEVSLEDGSLAFKAVLDPAPKSAPRAAAESATLPGEPDPPRSEAIRSPLVGYFQAPEAPVAVGDQVKVGQVVGVVLSLGDIPYVVESHTDGEVVAVHVAADQPVEYGQPLYDVQT